MNDTEHRERGDERPAPDSLRGKLGSLFAEGADASTDGGTKLETDAGIHVPTGEDEPPTTAPKRPTDPPF